MGSINKQISRFECTAVYTHPEARVDVVLIHGLNGEPQKTWTAKNGIFWPTDLLPDSLKDAHANVLVYGYNADVYSSRNDKSASDNFIYHHAQTLITTLTLYRKSEESARNPIIFVAHSLGGILLKRALEYSSDVRVDQHEEYRSIYVSTFGIIFLGTPHTGSDLATWGHMLQSMSDVIIPKKIFESEPVLLKTLKKDNETLQNINNHFLDIYQRFRIHMAHENHKTDIKGSKVLVVDSMSASPQLPGVTYYGIEATHSGMCKFESANAPGYRTVSTTIRDWVREAPPVIAIRWHVEDEDRLVRAKQDINERMRPFLTQSGGQDSGALVMQNPVPITFSPDIGPPSPVPMISNASKQDSQLLIESQVSDPLFIHPEPFRPNSFFIGREDELKDLHKMLMDRKRRSEGTSAVLIQCLPGGGKTHLARQYVFHHKADYPGGIYWVRAKSIQEMEYWYWRIARHEALRDLVEDEDIEKDFEELRDPQKIVEIVRKWLNSFEDWLLILDGILFDSPGVEKFIPDAQNTSIIFTSTERTATGDPRFDNPQLMELPLLSAQEAQDLLLMELDKKKPYTHDDRSRALELVQLMGRLPLMIHVTAQHLKATREPLARYLRSYQNRPQVGSLPAYKAVWDQLQHRGAIAALNLMSILVFFDQQIPVEMIYLGLHALDKRTPYKTCDASHRKPSLTNTLEVLIAFALVERTEGDDISPTSSRSSKKSLDIPSDALDLLRVHSVVQAFFIETLKEEKQHNFWLERAVAIFCRSFDEADKRIKDDAKIGLPDDYRRFAIHGRRLLDHVNRFEKKAPDLASVRTSIEKRLAQIQESIHTLSHNMQTQIVDKSGDGVTMTSIFERANSLSESDSATPSSHSTNDRGHWIQQHEGDDHALYQSPATYTPEQYNPYHWHVPVPYPSKPTMPEGPGQGDDDDRTVIVPTPRRSKDTDQATDDTNEWKMVGPNHRTVKKIEQRRYHDRAGAWRDQSVGDPRVSMSREIAKGSIFHVRSNSSSSGKANLTATSDAELALNKIRKISPPNPRGGGVIQDKGRSYSSETGTRPLLLIGRNSYAAAASGKADDVGYANSPGEFSSGLAKVTAATSSWTSATKATIDRLRENFSPTKSKAHDENKQPAPSPAGSPRLGEQPSQTSPNVDAGSMFQGSRSARSSPAQGSGPFYPPGLPVESNTTGSLHQAPPAAIQHWETTVYHPGLSRIDSSNLSEEPMAMSYPSIRQPYSVNVYPPNGSWMPAPDGYTSQPMSRDPSHQSSNPSSSNNAHSVGSGNLTAGAHASHHSSPLAGSPVNAGHEHPRPIASRARRPSLVETEPSPRREAAFPDVDTSYQRWEEAHARRPRAGSGSLFASNNQAPFSARRRGGRGGPAFRGRSQSQSPSAGVRSRGFGTPQRSPELDNRSFEGGQGSQMRGEDMARSGSGGIRLADGRIIEFGEIPVNVDEARQRAQEGAVRTTRSEESSVVGLGIMDEGSPV